MLGLLAHQGVFWKPFCAAHRRNKLRPNETSRPQRCAEIGSFAVKSASLASAEMKQGDPSGALRGGAFMHPTDRDVLLEKLEIDLMGLHDSCAGLMFSKPEITGLGKTKLRLQQEVPYSVFVCAHDDDDAIDGLREFYANQRRRGCFDKCEMP